MSSEIYSNMVPVVEKVLGQLAKVYWQPMHEYLKAHPELVPTFTAFLQNPETVVVYVGRTHLAIEYLGAEKDTELRAPSGFNVRILDCAIPGANLMEQIIGFKYDSTVPIGLPLEGQCEDLILPTNRGFDQLTKLGWNFAAQNMLLAMNSPAPVPMPGRFARIVNGLFFDADENGLITRHIKWIDFIPLEYDDTGTDKDSIAIDLSPYSELVRRDAHYVYPLPDEFKFTKLQRLNRFIEFAGGGNRTEPEITSLLASNDFKFIVTMRFGAADALSQKTLEWQSEKRDPIKPDFLLVNTDGYADILEFKLPKLKGAAVTGRTNRETFSAEINSYIAQTRVYRQYFEDPNNRRWVADKLGIKAYRPRRILVLGRRSDLLSEEWREVASEHADLQILSYDDLVDGVIAQFYK